MDLMTTPILLTMVAGTQCVVHGAECGLCSTQESLGEI